MINVTDMEEAGIGPSGESGEYHAVVTDGRFFPSELTIKAAGHYRHEAYWFLKVNL
jgi:diphthamide synthase (EF-2-diphthine--ammonia ligase)